MSNQSYSEGSFWKKMAKTAARGAVGPALKLYYAQGQAATPAWAKALIFSALGYFIWPADAIPDILPGIGYGDDIAVMTAALGTVAAYITPTVKDKAKQKLNEWIG